MVAGADFDHSREVLDEADSFFDPLYEECGVIHWVTDIDTNQILYINDFAAKMFEVKRESMYANRYAAVDRIHPEDRDRVLSAINGVRETGDVDVTYRVILPSGRRRWLQACIRLLPGRQGQSTRVVGVAVDVTGNKTNEVYNSVNHALSRIIAEGVPPQQALPRLLETLADPLGWTVAVLWVCGPEPRTLVCEGAWSRSDPHLATYTRVSRGLTLPVDDRFPTCAWTSNQRVVSTRLSADLHPVREQAAISPRISASAVATVDGMALPRETTDLNSEICDCCCSTVRVRLRTKASSRRTSELGPAQTVAVESCRNSRPCIARRFSTRPSWSTTPHPVKEPDLDNLSPSQTDRHQQSLANDSVEIVCLCEPLVIEQLWKTLMRIGFALKLVRPMNARGPLNLVSALTVGRRVESCVFERPRELRRKVTMPSQLRVLRFAFVPRTITFSFPFLSFTM